MIKVAIDTSSLASPHRFRGVGAYIKNLIETFEIIDTEGIKIEPVNLKKFDDTLYPKPYSLIHYPHFEPCFLSLPTRLKTPMVVTVHDLIPLIFPRHFPKGFRGWFKWQIQKSSIRKATMIITDSENSKKDIVRLVKTPRNKIRVIYLAPGKEFKKLGVNDRLLIKAKSEYQLPERFILYVGDLNWNKNVNGMLKAFQELKAIKPNLKLVLTGKAFEDKSLKEFKAIKSLIKKLRLEREVIILGFVPLEDLVAIYNQATVYCQPSFYEGFGLPVLEAMACGCPVVCSQTASLPEIGGEAVVYVSPKNTKDIARGLSKVLQFDKQHYQEQVKKSLERAEKFSWQKTAKETLRVYQEVLRSER